MGTAAAEWPLVIPCVLDHAAAPAFLLAARRRGAGHGARVPCLGVGTETVLSLAAGVHFISDVGCADASAHGEHVKRRGVNAGGARGEGAIGQGCALGDSHDDVGGGGAQRKGGLTVVVRVAAAIGGDEDVVEGLRAGQPRPRAVEEVHGDVAAGVEGVGGGMDEEGAGHALEKVVVGGPGSACAATEGRCSGGGQRPVLHEARSGAEVAFSAGEGGCGAGAAHGHVAEGACAGPGHGHRAGKPAADHGSGARKGGAASAHVGVHAGEVAGEARRARVKGRRHDGVVADFYSADIERAVCFGDGAHHRFATFEAHCFDDGAEEGGARRREHAAGDVSVVCVA